MMGRGDSVANTDCLSSSSPFSSPSHSPLHLLDSSTISASSAPTGWSRSIPTPPSTYIGG
jgi:hypothetical protein